MTDHVATVQYLVAEEMSVVYVGLQYTARSHKILIRPRGPHALFTS